MEFTLNPCRKCGSDAIVHEQKLSFLKEKSEFRAGCGTCSNSGPWRYDEKEAIDEWNSKNKARTTVSKTNTDENTPSPAGLDYEMRFDDLMREWQIWTPAFDGATGAILGTGITELDAEVDAVRNMEHLSKKLKALRSNNQARDL